MNFSLLNGDLTIILNGRMHLSMGICPHKANDFHGGRSLAGALMKELSLISNSYIDVLSSEETDSSACFIR